MFYVVIQMYAFVYGMEGVTNKHTCHHANRNSYQARAAQG